MKNTSLKIILEETKKLKNVGQYSNATKLLNDNYPRFKKNTHFLATLAHSYILQNQYQTASSLIKKAKTIDPNCRFVCWNEIRLLINNKDLSSAIHLAKKCYKLFYEISLGIIAS